MKNTAIIFSLILLTSCEKKNPTETVQNKDSIENMENSSVSETQENLHLTQENFENGQPAIFKDIVKENDVYLVSVDNIEEKYNSKNNDDKIEIKTTNKNPKIRVFKLNENTVIQNENCEKISAEFVYIHKKQFLQRKDKIGYTAENGKMTSLNFGCWQ